ncbi:hypothetical protein [Anaerovibrio slackiae]|uniref:hypothetical protein n=1 Tax=Anaerovibrio slackiae TaxID=2652309 RepID=UPI003F147A03
MRKLIKKLLLHMVYSKYGRRIADYFRAHHLTTFMKIKSYIVSNNEVYSYNFMRVSTFVESFESRVKEKIKS